MNKKTLIITIVGILVICTAAVSATLVISKNNKINEEFSETIKAEKEGEERALYLRSNYPLLRKLPFKNPFFTIDYEVSSDNSVKITIHAREEYISLGYDKIKSLLDDGDSIDNYPIVEDVLE